MKNLYASTLGKSLICLTDKRFNKNRSPLFLISIIFLVCSINSYAQKTWVSASSGNWSVGTNWSGGTVPTSSDNVVLTPAGARTITVDAPYTVNNLTVGNNTTLNFNSTNSLTVNGNFLQSGGVFNGGTGTLFVKGSFSKTAGTFNEGSGSLRFNGTGAQTISVNDANRSFYNMVVNNGSTLTIIAPATNLTIANSFNLANGSFVIGTNTLTLNGSVSSMSAANNITGSASSNLVIGGSGSLGTLFFNTGTPGTSNQLNNCTINRSSGIIDLGNDVNIRTGLTLTNGIISTSTNKVIINSTGTVSRTNGYINGNLQKYVATGAASRTFEIGDLSNYTPISINFASVTVAGDLLVSTSTPLSSYSNIGSIYLNTSQAVNRYWTLSNVNTLAFTTYSGTFNFQTADVIGGANTANLKAGVYSSSWTYPTMGTLNATNSTFNSASSLGTVVLATCLAPTAYSITGGGAYCSGGAGVAVGLSNSETGVSYQLQLAAVNIGSPVSGTGSAISFGNQTPAGNYTIMATRTATGCTASMTGTATVSINALPALTVTGSTYTCAGSASIQLNYSSPVNSPDEYEIIWGTAAHAAGFTDVAFAPVTGGTITIGGMQNSTGNFPVIINVRNNTTGCVNNISSGSICGMVNENQTLSLSAPNGSSFTGVSFASYGTPTGTCGTFATSGCHASGSLSIVQAAAIGNSSFSVAATNGVFGDPCSGTVKRLYVEAVYGFSVNISPALNAVITGTSTICSGSSTTLTAPVATTYLWSTGETTQSITVSPTSTTTYGVTISNAGCNSVGSKTITVNPLPSVTIVNTAPAVCSGTTSVQLTYTSPVNSPDQYSIIWTAAGNAAGLSNVVLAPLSGGIITLSSLPSTAGVYGANVLIANSTTGCSSSISGGVLCGTANENTMLTMTTPNGTKFMGINFASYGTPTGTCGSYATSSCHASGSLSIIQGLAIGNSTFTVNASNAVFTDPCVGTTKRLYVEAFYSNFALSINAIPATPTAGSNSPVCSGNTINLTASTVAGATYAWTGPGGFTSALQNPSIPSSTTSMTGTYSVRATVAGCNSVSTGNVSVVVNQAPSATISYAGTAFCSSVSSGQSVSLAGTTGGTFTAPAALSINSGTGAILPSSSTVGGPYTVTYSIAASGGCALYSTTTAVSILAIPAATTASGGGTFCATRTITASGGTGGTIYFQGNTSNGTSTAIASSSQVVTNSGTYYFRARNVSGCWGTQGSVTVTIVPTPTCTGASLAASYCSGTGAVINLTGLVPGSTNTISYTINGVAQSAITGVVASAGGTASFTSASLTIANNGQTLRVTGINNGTCATVTFAYNVTLVYAAANTWRGINTNWNDAQNWCGGVPSASANVTIPSGVSYYPVINSGTVQVNNLSISSGASVTVSAAKIAISGAISNSGTFTISNGTLDLTGTSASQSIAGSMFTSKTIKNLIISNANGVSLSGTNDTLKIAGTLGFGTSNAVFSTNNNLTLLSNASGTARVTDMTNAGANSGNNITGNVTVERYIPNHPKAWQLLAVPTSGQTIRDAWQEGNSTLANTRPGYGTIITSNVANAVAAGFDIYTPSGPTMKVYNPSTNGWDEVANTSTQLIDNKKGYMFFIRGDRSVTTFTAAPTATTLRTTGKLYTIGADAPQVTTVSAGKFESIGNPYASAIDFTLLTKPASPAIDDQFYVWDPLLTNSASGLGGYQTISATNSWKPSPGGTANYDANTVYPYIQSGQAFFVHATGVGGTVSFTESCKADISNLVNRNIINISGRQFLRTYLYNQSGILTDGNVLAFDTAFQNTVDADDALKMVNTGENFGIQSGSSLLSIEARSPVEGNDTVYYRMANLRKQPYQLKFAAENIDSSLCSVYLIDKFLNNTTPIQLVDTMFINFTVTTDPASGAADRFYLVFNRTHPVRFESVSGAHINRSSVKVNWVISHEAGMNGYEVSRSTDGNRYSVIALTDVNDNANNTVSNTHVDPVAPAGNLFYKIRGIKSNGESIYSQVVKILPEKVLSMQDDLIANQPVKTSAENNPSIVVAPNPVMDKIMHVFIKNFEQGSYKVELVNQGGQVVHHEQIAVREGQTKQSIVLNKSLPSGNYVLRIFDQNSLVSNIKIYIK